MVETSYTLTVGGAAVIKAQVLAGGRGKGQFDSGLQGGVKLAKRYAIIIMQFNDVVADPSITFIVLDKLRHMPDKCWGINLSQNKLGNQEDYARRSAITLSLSDSLTKSLCCGC